MLPLEVDGLMARFALKRISFVSTGFRGVLNSPGLESVVAAEARKSAQAKEREAGEPYAVERMAAATSRVVYVARPEGDDAQAREKIDHETWMNDVWPKVGGPKWRPHS